MARTQALAAAVLLSSLLALLPHGGQAALPFGGASSSTRLLNQWIFSLKAQHRKVTMVPYIATNSPDALLGLKSDKFLCAVSDIPYAPKDEQYFDKYTFPLMINTFSLFTGGNIIPRLTGAQISAIMLGQVTHWRQIPGARYKGNGAIELIVRADPSGTTYLVTQYLRHINPKFPSQLFGQGPYKYGPTTVGAHGTAAQIALIKANPNAIGWAASSEGYEAKLVEVAIPNGAGKFVKAATSDVYPSVNKTGYPTNRAFSWAAIPPKLLFSPDPRSYPIVGFVYGITRKNYYKSKDAFVSVMKATLIWTQSPAGQALGKVFHYQPVPAALRVTNGVYMKQIVVRDPLPF